MYLQSQQPMSSNQNVYFIDPLTHCTYLAIKLLVLAGQQTLTANMQQNGVWRFQWSAAHPGTPPGKLSGFIYLIISYSCRHPPKMIWAACKCWYWYLWHLACILIHHDSCVLCACAVMDLITSLWLINVAIVTHKPNLPMYSHSQAKCTYAEMCSCFLIFKNAPMSQKSFLPPPFFFGPLKVY